MKYGIIYKITNKITNKIYIGKTVQKFKRRCRPQGYKTCTALYNSILLHGWENFEREEFICALDEKHLASLEEQTINFYNSLIPNGYNIIKIDKGLNRYSDETKKKISLSRHNTVANQLVPVIPSNRRPAINIDGIDHKECNCCKTLLPIDLFAKNSSRWDGIATVCKKCFHAKYNSKQDRRMLSPEQLAESYKARKESMRLGVLNSYKNNPKLSLQKSLERAKPLVATHIETGSIIEFQSALDAKKSGFNNSNISTAIKNNVPYKKHTWKFK